MYVTAYCPTPLPTRMHMVFCRVFFFFKGSGFVANINIWAKAFCPAFFFFLKASLSLWMSLSSLLLYRYVHDTKPCLLPCLSLKALILAFSYCSRFSSLVVSICKKKKKKVIPGWVFSLSTTVPNAEGLLIFAEAITAASIYWTHFFINFSKALIILRGWILGPVMSSNLQYLQSFFVWDLKVPDNSKSSVPWLSQKHLWT